MQTNQTMETTINAIAEEVAVVTKDLIGEPQIKPLRDAELSLVGGGSPGFAFF